MTNQQLQRLVQRISLKYFARPFRHRVCFDPYLRSTGGRYHLRTHNIDINPKMLTDFSRANLIGVIKHELCHYHLHLAGYSGRHGTRAFQQLLQMVGGSRYAPQPRHLRWRLYQCRRCGRIYWRRRTLNVSRYICGCCHGHLHFLKKVD